MARERRKELILTTVSSKVFIRPNDNRDVSEGLSSYCPPWLCLHSLPPTCGGPLSDWLIKSV
jgi:hypothetical protein